MVPSGLDGPNAPVRRTVQRQPAPERRQPTVERRPRRRPLRPRSRRRRDICPCPGLEGGHTDEDRHGHHDRDGTTRRPSERLGRWYIPRLWGGHDPPTLRRDAAAGAVPAVVTIIRARRATNERPGVRVRFDIEEGSCVPRDPFRGLARRGSAATILAVGAAAGWWLGGRSSRPLDGRRHCRRPPGGAGIVARRRASDRGGRQDARGTDDGAVSRYLGHRGPHPGP